jgi:RNA polymerase sigma factor (sigma-70 family)
MMLTAPNNNAAVRLVTEWDAQFRRPLISFFRRGGVSQDEAEDLTQQLFLRVLAGRAEGVERPSAYVFKIAANLLRDHRRSRARHREDPLICDDTLTEDVVHQLADHQTPERTLVARETLRAVLSTLDELDRRTRDMFMLFRLEHMKQREIAALYRVGLSTVERELAKANCHLQRKDGPDERWL